MRKTKRIIIPGVIICLSFAARGEPETIYFEIGDPESNGLTQTISAQSISKQSVSTQETTLVPNRTMPPTVETSSVGTNISTIEFNATCTIFYTPIPNCDIVFEIPYGEPYSGGHDHDNTARPGGLVDPMSGNTGDDYILPVTYTAPEVSGYINLWGTATAQELFGSVRKNFIIQVSVPGLVALPPSENYDLVGQFGTTSPNGNAVKSKHYNNHYGTPAINASVVKLANEYRYEYPNDKLKINDISLKWGGVFDTKNSWTPPHTNHRFGRNVDISLVDVHNSTLFRFLSYTSGFTYVAIESSHYHVSR